jgi:hypothetical protein
MFVFFIFRKNRLIKVINPVKIYQKTTFHGPRLTVQGLHSPQKFERPPFWNGCSYII